MESPIDQTQVKTAFNDVNEVTEIDQDISEPIKVDRNGLFRFSTQPLAFQFLEENVLLPGSILLEDYFLRPGSILLEDCFLRPGSILMEDYFLRPGSMILENICQACLDRVFSDDEDVDI